MPAPRLSQSETARAAALQAEFNEKKWVWVPDEKEGYLAGWVNKEEDEEAEIIMAAGGDVRLPPRACDAGPDRLRRFAESRCTRSRR
jgi:myosin heavy chain 9/10/11/14